MRETVRSLFGEREESQDSDVLESHELAGGGVRVKWRCRPPAAAESLRCLPTYNRQSDPYVIPDCWFVIVAAPGPGGQDPRSPGRAAPAGPGTSEEAWAAAAALAASQAIQRLAPSQWHAYLASSLCLPHCATQWHSDWQPEAAAAARRRPRAGAAGPG